MPVGNSSIGKGRRRAHIGEPAQTLTNFFFFHGRRVVHKNPLVGHKRQRKRGPSISTFEFIPLLLLLFYELYIYIFIYGPHLVNATTAATAISTFSNSHSETHEATGGLEQPTRETVTADFLPLTQ